MFRTSSPHSVPTAAKARTRPTQPAIDVEKLVESLRSSDRVTGLTHPLYRYPARFSPLFARAAIMALTEPGDFILDPFSGGGTTVVEALSLGRKAVGVDLNPLASFVARAKTTLLSVNEGARLLRWAERMDEVTTARWHRGLTTQETVDNRVPWAIRKSLQLGIESTGSLDERRIRRMARASLLRLGQWALDGRSEVPTRRELLDKHVALTKELIAGSHALGTAAGAAFGIGRAEAEKQRRIITTSAEMIGSARAIPTGWGKPKLILTSPPYHGKHILYHRWQVEGRRETNAPYWVAGAPEHGQADYYTFGRRAFSEEVKGEYFDNALRCFIALHAACGDETQVVQLVGFSNPKVQLPLYKEMMREAGFRESVPHLGSSSRLNRRRVPNRKWYMATLEECAKAEHEFLLIHTPR